MPRWLAGALVLLSLALPAAASAAEPEQKISGAEATAIADKDPTVADQRRKNGSLTSSVKMNDERWEVAYFGDDKQVALAIVDPQTGEVEEAWTGHQVAWRMARGYSGAFGHKLNAPYVFIPLCLFFLIGLIDWRRLRRVANLDLLVLLGFGVSHFFFNRAEIGVSVPLYYPVLVYLFARALWIGFRGRGEGLRPVWPTVYLLVAALFLMGVRTGLNMADAGVADIGYASVVGADRITHGEPIYGNFPDDVSQGDTYGPVNYYAYVPFELVFPWGGSWDDLPAGHAAAFTFDLLVFGLLILLARRIRPGPEGKRLAAILAFGWAAYPYTAYALESNTNDPLVALFLVGILLLLSRPVARGALAAAATLAKFAPAVLAPMLLTYEAKRRPMLLFAAGFALVSALALLWPAIDPGLKTFYERTFEFQADRSSPFSIWGQVEALAPLRTALIGLTAALAVLLAFRPREKSLVQVAALSAALIIAVSITMKHWFYLYIDWFYPLLLVALAALPAAAGSRKQEEEPEPSPARTSRPAPVR
ncbi:MAG TPA: PepSY domain-containing protein [Solirubrobacterales bacterium]|nr:PepSY domain-containing protein [Solirubrobacterales bacterium]